MRWNIFALNGESNISKRVKNVSYRSLRMESLEKRELLSAAPDGFSLLDGEGKLTRAGWLVYTVVDNETSNPATSAVVGNITLGGNEGAGTARFFVEVGQALPEIIGSENTQVDNSGILPVYRFEDYIDEDYNDLAISVTFEPLTIGTEAPSTCDTCSCATDLNFGANIKQSKYLSKPEDSGSLPIRVESVFPTIGGIAPQPQMMTATLQYGNQTKTVYYDTSTFDPSDVFTVGMDLDTSTMTSGRYDWTMTLTYDYGNNVTQTQTFTGAEDVVNRSASPYGSGLNLTGLSSLNLTNLNALTNRGINWERSCGKQVWFSYDGSSFTPEAGESAESTLVQNLNGTYTLVDQGETFLFNAAGQLLTRTNNLTDKTVTWTYNLDGTADTKTDEANRMTTFQYTNGKLASVTDSAGRTTAYQYDSLGRLTSVTEPDPDGNGSLTSLVTSYTYDGNSSRVATITDASGNVTAYTYSNGQVVSKTVNGITQSTQDPFVLSAIIDTMVTGYDADHLADLPKALETNGQSTNLSGNQTEYRYDTFGNVIWKRTASGVETSFLYDTNGRLRKETESVMVNGRSQGRSTEYGYDVNGNLIKIKYHDGSTEEWTYDANFNQMLSYKDQLGNRTLYTLDSNTGLTLSERRVVGQVDSSANGETDDVVTTYSYNTNRTLASVTNALGVVTSYTYDSHGNVLTETTGSATTTYTYDSADRRTSVTNALNQTTSYTYDNLDRLVQTTYSNGQTSQSVYNNAGQLVQTIDLNGAVTSYTYNASGKIAAIVSPGSSVSYTYDSLGRVSTETDSLNRVTTYTYNAGGKLASTTISDGNAQSAVISRTTYDAWGRTATQTDATGVTLTYNYDKFDRVTSITRTNDNVVLETRTYDKAGNLKTVQDAAGAVTTYTYDSLGNVTQIKAADNSTTSFTYDKLGRVLTQTDALGNVTSYTYDIYGNLVSTTDALNHQTTSTYNAIGQQVSYTDALNNVTTYAYDALGRVTSTTLTSASGTQSTTQTTAYSTQTINGVTCRIVTTTDALNQSTTSAYDLAGRLVKTTAADNSVTTYTYDTEGQLLTTTDALNHSTSYTYDVFGNVSTITQADGTIYRYNYNAAGQLLSQTDPLGTITSYTYDLNGQVTETKVRDKALPGALGTWLETAQTFDGVDDSVTIPNTSELNVAGEITLSAWVKVEDTNGFRSIVEHGYYEGREVFLRISYGIYQVGVNFVTDHYAEASVDPADIGTWVHLVGTYDGTNWNLYKNGELVASTASTVGAVTLNCDWLIGASQYPGRLFKGDIREVGIWDSALSTSEAATLYEQGFSAEITQSATYDAVGNLLTQTDAMGNTTSYTYDSMGRVVTMTDALNNVTSYTYDALGRLLTTTDARGTVTKNTYDAVGNLLKTVQFDSALLPQPVNSWLPVEQDFNGTSDTVNIGNDSSLNFEGEITVSAWVKIDSTGGLKTILGHGHGDGKEVYLRLIDNLYQFGSWDSATDNHLVSANIPAEDIGEWVHLVGTYDGANWNLYRNGALLASNADTVGSLTVNANWHIGSSNGNSRFFDGEIREVAIWDSALNAAQAAAVYAGTTPSADYPTVVTSYTYDAAGHLLTLTDPVGNTTSYTYNYMGLVATETNEKNATRYYSYDALGRLVSKTDRNGRITTYSYDTIGRLTAENWSNTTNYFMYTYDAVGNLLYATDGQHSYSYAYDALNRPIYTTFNFDSQSAVFAYTYDLAGRRTVSSLSLNGHSDRVNQVTYDFLGNATKITQTGSAVDEIFAEFDYNANGLMTAVRRYEEDANDVVTSIAESLYTFNANNAVTSITHKNPNGTQIVQHSYTYDNTNNIVEYLNSIDGQTSYDYDFLGQLVSADHASQTDESYAYDSNGNRIVANGDAYTTGTNNELTSDGDYTYTYDAEGNRTSKTNSTNRELYTWDYRNRLTSVTQQEWDSTEQEWVTVQTVEYTYDYNNVWIRKTVGNNSTIFIPENYQTTVQIDNGTVSHHYLWTPNQQDKLLADTTTSGILWALTDHLGTIRDVLDGNSSTHLIYDAFGNIVSGTNPLLFGYTGKAFDTATNLQNNINRWYDAAIGRWLSTDPIGFEGNDTNLYRYVKNKSTIYVDSSGLIVVCFTVEDACQKFTCYEYCKCHSDIEEKYKLLKNLLKGPGVSVGYTLILSKDQAKVVEAANGDPEIEKILASLFTSSYKIPGYWKSKLDGIWYYYFEKGEHEAGLGSCGTWANNMQVEIDKIISPSQAYRPGYNINAGSVGLFPVKKHWWYESHMAIQVKIVKYENCKSSLCFEFYMDDGFLGKDDHIFFPEDIRGRWK